MIRQRFLYVGIGGSGLDIGRELTAALTREVCGLDGRRLVARGGPFAGFAPGQLPRFIQSVYLDFSRNALDEINTHLRGKNATAIHTILPPFNSSQDAAAYLRNQRVSGVDTWIPNDSEVNVAPLTNGAGQYPTIGRIALFASLKRQGYQQTLGRDLGAALDALGQSTGELTSFTGATPHSNSLAVYVGFSLAGGTGCGVFYDVIHLLYNEIVTRFADVPCTIMPIVIMPSLFDSVLHGVNRRNTQLNAATALLDLSRLMDLFNNPDPELAAERRVMYPWNSVGGPAAERAINLNTQFGNTVVKVATLVEQRGGLSRTDVYRSIASSIVSQVSTVAEVNQINMGFVDKLVNDNEIPEMHHTLLGRKNIMPAVSASLTLPSERLAEVISQRILADGLRAQSSAITSRVPTQEHVSHFLDGSGQGEIMRPEKFNSQVPITFAVPPAALQEESKFRVFQGNLERKMADSLIEVTRLIGDRIPEIQSVNTLDGLERLLDSNTDRNLSDALEIGGRAIGALRGNWFDEAPVAARTRGRGRTFRLPFLKRRPKPADAERWVKTWEAKYVAEVRAAWREAWRTRQVNWRSSVDDAERLIAELRRALADQLSAADGLQLLEIGKLRETTLGVVEYLPSQAGDMERTLTSLINDVKQQVRERYGISETDDGSLLSAIMRSDQRNHWNDALRDFARNRDFERFIDRLTESVRVVVLDELQDVLPPLAESLDASAHAAPGARTPELEQLHSKLAGLLPEGVIPPVRGGKPRVLVTYPGVANQHIEDYLRDTIFGARYADFDRHEVFKFSAVGNTSSLTASINIIAHGLLDSEEVRHLFATHLRAIQDPIASDRLIYRQRVGYGRLQDLTDATNRRTILRNFLSALYDGHIGIISGSIDWPESIRVQVPGAPAYFDLELTSMYGASPWSSLFNSYEERIVTANALANTHMPEAIKWFGEYRPQWLSFNDKAPQRPSELFESIINVVLEYQAKATTPETLLGLTPVAIAHREAIRKFWQNDIVESMLAPYTQFPNFAFYSIAGVYVATGASEAMRNQLRAAL